MDSDSGSYFNSSMLLKASLLTITFSTINFYKTERQLPFLKMHFAKADTVLEKNMQPIMVKKKKKKTIYLTFDDGPNKGSTKVMDIINQEQIPATVFVIGEHVYGSKEQKVIWDSMKHNQWLEIANHSFTHAFENKFCKFYSYPDTVAIDFKRCADSLHFTNNIVRTPGRNIWRTENINYTDLKNSSAAADTIKSKGFTAIGWDLEWHFTDAQTLVQSDSLLLSQIDSVFANDKTKTINHLILLAHDRTFFSQTDSASLHNFVKMLKKRDEYNFETVDKYPCIK